MSEALLSPHSHSYLNNFAELQQQLIGADHAWLQKLREQAFTQFTAEQFPNRYNEEWKYTSLYALQNTELNLSQQIQSELDTSKYVINHPNAINIIISDGLVINNLQSQQLPAGLSIESLATALQSKPQLIESILTKLEAKQQDSMLALNQSFMQAGLFINVANDTVCEQPIHITYIATQAQTSQFIRNIINLEAGAQANIIEHFISPLTAEYFVSAINQFVLAANANCKHCKIMQESCKAFHIVNNFADQAANSNFISQSFAISGKLLRNDTEVNLNAANAKCDLQGLYIGDEAEHIDHHTAMNHHVADCVSRENYKGILAKKSHGVFNGKVFVAQDAQHTDSDQSNKNLLLSNQAEIDTKPQLEIYADDVRCTHGAAIGQLDPKAVFYLQSRGIDKLTAQQLLITGFANEVLHDVTDTTIKNYLQQAIDSKLAKIIAELP